MKKFGLLAAVLFGSLLLAGCNNSTKNDVNLETDFERMEACADKVGFYLNINDYSISWEDEEEGGASFIRNGHVEYTKQGEKAEDDVQCIVDMVDKSVDIEFSNHKYNGELQMDSCTGSSCELSDNIEETIYSLIEPGNGFDEEFEAGKLVLRKGFEDHTDIIFINKEMWQDYLNPDEIVYGGEVIFKGELTPIDGAAGTHYYNADNIEVLKELSNN